MLSRQYDCSENGSCGMWTELRVIIRQDSEKERERVHFTCHQSNPSQSVPPHVGTMLMDKMYLSKRLNFGSLCHALLASGDHYIRK